MSNQSKKATFAGGCFWCVEAVFKRIQGVKSVTSGYTGGDVENPSYRDVSSGRTGHAEAVQIVYDPEEITYRKLLEVFFGTHDPTTLNRQGPDVGTQYRSAIFYHNDEQKEEAEGYIEELEESGVWDDSIVTEVTPFVEFFEAEDYHQDYYEENPNAGYCRVVITPKIQKLRKNFKKKLKKR